MKPGGRERERERGDERKEDREIVEDREIGVEGLKEIRRLKGKVEKDEW